MLLQFHYDQVTSICVFGPIMFFNVNMKEL